MRMGRRIARRQATVQSGMLSRILALVSVGLTACASALTPPPHQRVLVPVSVADVPGAVGSLWTAELWAVNANAEKAGVAALPCLVDPVAFCAATVDLLAGRSTRIPPLGNADSPGVLLLVPTHLANQIGFTLHVRDLSRQSESWGAEIPVVRERDFFTNPSHITSIPFGSGYRQTLRIYALLDSISSARFRVKLYEVTGTANDRLLREDIVTLEPPPPPPPNRIGTPLAQITLTDLFAIEIGGVNRVRVSIEPMTEPTALLPPIPYWAFVSITNNQTQQVTTVTPR